MSKRSLAIISGVALIVVGIIIGFVLYGRDQVAQAPSPSEQYVAEKNEQASAKIEAPSGGLVLGTESGEITADKNPVSANSGSADVIGAVAERLAALQRDLVILRDSETGRMTLALELETLKQELLALQEQAAGEAPADAGQKIAEAATKIERAQNIELTASARRADLMITITAIGERLIALGKLTLAYKATLEGVSLEGPGFLVGVTYQ